MLIEDALQRDVDYAQLAKIYGEDAQERAKRRYSPAECLGTKREARIGRPDLDHISTSFVEKHNQTMRQSMRRYACLPVGHSKKLEIIVTRRRFPSCTTTSLASARTSAVLRQWKLASQNMFGASKN
jgi:hypothetical protein